MKDTLAKKYANQFVQKTRSDNKKFIALTSDRDEELRDFIQDVHFDLFDGCLPNDWIYSTVSEAFDDYSQYSDKDAFIYESKADCYYYNLSEWIKEPFAIEYLDQVLEEGDFKRFFDIVSEAQARAIQDIRQKVCAFLEEQQEKQEEEE